MNEAKFKLEIGDKTKYLFEGQIDQLRLYPDGRLELLDFKSGVTVPGNNEMRRNYQFAVYALAVRDGKFYPTRSEESGQGETIIGKLPDMITWYHLKDHLEYQKPTAVVPIDQRVGKVTDSYYQWFTDKAEIYSLDEIRIETKNNKLSAKPPKVYFNAGHQKGPGRHVMNLTPHRIEIMRKSIIHVCAAMRMNIYLPNPSACPSCRMTDTCDYYMDGLDKPKDLTPYQLEKAIEEFSEYDN